MSKPKFIKPLLIGCACAIPVGLVVGLSVNWDHRQFISSVGSSGVKPFEEAFARDFATTNPKIDVQIESGGTTFAIEEVAKGLTNIGNASNNPYYTINKKNAGYRDQWKNKKTFTLGFEGLIIMYKMPDGLSKKAQEAFDIVINKDNILQLFAVFSGFNQLGGGEKWKTQYGSIYNFMTADSIAAIEALPTGEKDIKLCKDTQITPFVRSGGNTAANSSIAFSYYSHLADFDNMTQDQQNAFAGGQYGKDRNHYETEESNARAWEMFSNNDIPGSMVYLTTGFVKNKHNQEEILKHNYKIAGYLDKEATKPVYFEKQGDLDYICTKKGYNWYRPINCMIDLDNQLSLNFIKAIYQNNSYKRIMSDNGAKPLTIDQFNSMCVNGDPYCKEASDLNLEKIRSSGEFKEVYGAEDLWE